MSFGNKIKNLRKQLKLTQIEMADKLLMNQSSYSRYESGRANPGIHIIQRVSNTFKVSMEWLMETNKSNMEHDHMSDKFENEVVQFLLEQRLRLDIFLNKLGGGGGMVFFYFLFL